MIYQWKAGARPPKLGAQSVGERLELLRQTHGRLTEDITIADARPKTALLHPAFEWNDKIAAEEHRREQARSLIRSVVAINEEYPNAPTFRAFITIGDIGDLEYTATYVAMADAGMREQVLSRALRELKQWQQRYSDLTELAEVFRAVEAVAA